MASILPVELTVGWPIGDQGNVDARMLHHLAEKYSNDGGSYDDFLLAEIQDKNIHRIDKLDELLRRRKGGFLEINHFTASLLKIVDSLDQFKGCRIDLFAFAFLTNAKNYDLFMKPSADNVKTLQEVVRNWQEVVQELEDFERLGIGLRSEYTTFKNIYLKLRAVISRPSARDEQRTLAVLLSSGPSTLEDINIDLGLNYSLTQRVMQVLQNTGAIERSKRDKESFYSVVETAIPVVSLLVRETVGLDLLNMTAGLLEEC